MFDFQNLWETFGEALALGLLVSPLAFFWCCCLTCGTCTSRKRKILVTFDNVGTWSNGGGCGCFEGPPNSCANYKGTTYEVPINFYSPYVGFGTGNAVCIYEVAGECDNHRIIVSIFTQFSSGSYANTLVRVQVFRTTVSGCVPTTVELNVSAATENPFDCDAPRTLNFTTSGNPMCIVTGGVAIVESP